MTRKKPITVITAPSCAGKDYLSKCLFTQFPGLFEMAVSCTTRPPREGEENGRDYNFLTLSEFKDLESNKRLLESVQFGDKCYGTSAAEIERIQAKGAFPVLIVEPVGAINIWNWCKENDHPAQFAFIDVDRSVALERFLDRFLLDFETILRTQEDEFLAQDGDTTDFDKAASHLVKNYSKRVYISMYEESSWKTALPYNLLLGKMLKEEDSVNASLRIKDSIDEIVRGERSGVPDQFLSVNEIGSGKKNPALYDMELVINKVLGSVKKETVNSVTLKGIILKSEAERLNQVEFNF